MVFKLEGRVAVVTGASRGIGAETARQLAEYGAQVALLARSKQDAERIASQAGRDSIAIRCDISSPEETERAFAEIFDRYGQINVVVANAGVPLCARKKLHRLTLNEWQEAITINLTGAFLTARAAYSYLRSSDSSRFLFISSAMTKAPTVGMSAYAASKSGLEGLTRSLAVEWAGDEINVNAVAPGIIDFGATAKISKEVQEKILKRTTVGRAGDITELTNLILFLASEESEYITGQVLSVDGGYALT